MNEPLPGGLLWYQRALRKVIFADIECEIGLETFLSVEWVSIPSGKLVGQSSVRLSV